MTKESQRAIAALMALIQTTENADIIHSLRYAIEAIHRAEKYQDMKSRLNRIDPISARFASSFGRNGISAVATENTIFGDTSM